MSCAHPFPNAGTRFAIKIQLILFRFCRVCERHSLLSSPLLSSFPMPMERVRIQKKIFLKGVEIQNKSPRKLHVMKDRPRKAFTFLSLMATGLGVRANPHIGIGKHPIYLFLRYRCRYFSLLRRHLSSPNFYSFSSLLLPLVSSYYYLTERFIHLVIYLATIIILSVS